MRQAADILSSAPAMQIRYLEAMQAMAKSANSKVIFLPGSSQTSNMSGLSAPYVSSKDQADIDGEGSGASHRDFGGQDPGMQAAINARIIENI